MVGETGTAESKAPARNVALPVERSNLGAGLWQDRLARVPALTYCSSLPEGLLEYDQWLRDPDPRRLQDLIRQYGGELIAPEQQLLVLEQGPQVTQLRTLKSKTICYLPTEILR